MKLFTWLGVIIGAIGASLFALQANAGQEGDSGKALGVAFLGMIGGVMGGGLGSVFDRLFGKKRDK